MHVASIPWGRAACPTCIAVREHVLRGDRDERMLRHPAFLETKPWIVVPSRAWSLIVSNFVVVSLLLGRSTADRLLFFDVGAVGDTPGTLFLFTLSMLLALGLPVAVLRRSPLNQRAKAALLTYLVLSIWMLVSITLSPLSLEPYGLNKAILAGPGIAVLLLMSASLLRFNDLRVTQGLFYSLTIWCLAIALLSVAGPTGRFAALGGGPNVFGRFMVLGALASLAIWESTGALRHLLLSVVFCIYALVSQSRGIFVGMILVASLIALGKFRQKTPKSTRRVRTLAVLVPTLTILLVLNLPGEGASRLRLRLVDYLLTDLPHSYAVNARISAIELALDLFGIRPLTGWGPGGFAAFSTLVYPHNLVAEAMVELGLVGLSALIVYLGLVVMPGPRDGLARVYHRYALLMALFSFVAAQFSGDFFDSRLFFFFGFVATALVSSPPSRGNADRRDRPQFGGAKSGGPAP
jgi:hypothetical protein